ncbi:LysR substrate-binding domain-containing protein [Dongia sp.]|jgi:DNA-binding transcriptional LysR family regulator|uniref:LysR substrate-binding domain-containing protein n=1 Tax=Dongia sp. TaxID=1977262 RepID=UPI0035B3D5F2
MSDRIFALQLFSRVARLASFSKAGREFGLSQPSASRIMADLEREVGAALLTRTTRAVTLTEAGTDYLARIEPILLALEEADHAARGTGELRGFLRIALSSSFGARVVIPCLPAFVARHPALRLDLIMSDQRQDLVGEGVDVALRLGQLQDSSATAQLIGVSPRIAVAAPAYLENAPELQVPADLAQHALIIGPTGPLTAWSFQRDGRSVSLRIDARLSVSANEGAVAAAVAGLGIVSTSAWGCQAEVAGGKLRRVLPDWDMGRVDIHAVFPAGRAAKPAARAIAEHLAQALASSP